MVEPVHDGGSLAGNDCQPCSSTASHADVVAMAGTVVARGLTVLRRAASESVTSTTSPLVVSGDVHFVRSSTGVLAISPPSLRKEAMAAGPTSNGGTIDCSSVAGGRTPQRRARESATTPGGHGDEVSTQIDSGLRNRNTWRSRRYVRHHLPLRQCCSHSVEHPMNVVFRVLSVRTAARIVFLDNAQQDQVCLQ
jgi:hypothetical protein